MQICNANNQDISCEPSRQFWERTRDGWQEAVAILILG